MENHHLKDDIRQIPPILETNKRILPLEDHHTTWKVVPVALRDPMIYKIHKCLGIAPSQNRNQIRIMWLAGCILYLILLGSPPALSGWSGRSMVVNPHGDLGDNVSPSCWLKLYAIVKQWHNNHVAGNREKLNHLFPWIAPSWRIIPLYSLVTKPRRGSLPRIGDLLTRLIYLLPCLRWFHNYPTYSVD